MKKDLIVKYTLVRAFSG